MIIRIKDENGNWVNVSSVKGDPFTFKDFTPEQLESLKGDKGDPGEDYILTADDKAEIATMVKVDNPQVDLSNYATKSELSDYATQTYVSTQIAQAQLGGAGNVDLSVYATKEEIPARTSQLLNDSGFITSLPDMSEYALKSDIPSTSGFALKSDIPSLSGYATESYVNTKVAAIPLPDLSKYALKTDLTNYTTMSAVEAKGYQTAADVQALIEAAGGINSYVNGDEVNY